MDITRQARVAILRDDVVTRKKHLSDAMAELFDESCKQNLTTPDCKRMRWGSADNG